MSTISQKLTAIAEAKADIKSAIINKGQTVSNDITTYAAAIGNISGGGTGYTGHVDATGLRAIGWTEEDIAYYQAHGVRWNADEDDAHKVPTSNIELYANATKTTVGGVTMAASSNFNSFKNSSKCYYFPKIDTSGMTSISFKNSYGLLAIPKFDAGNVTDMGSMFQNCYYLLSIDVSGFDTSNVTNMGSMFSGCYSLLSIDVSGFDTSNVTNMGSMFSGCYNAEIHTGSLFKMDSISSASGLPRFDNAYNSSTSYKCVKMVFESIIASTMSISSPSFTFAVVSKVFDDADGTLATLKDACVANGWVIANLTIVAYGG